MQVDDLGHLLLSCEAGGNLALHDVRTLRHRAMLNVEARCAAPRVNLATDVPSCLACVVDMPRCWSTTDHPASVLRRDTAGSSNDQVAVNRNLTVCLRTTAA